jgi:hypothetical protein
MELREILVRGMARKILALASSIKPGCPERLTGDMANISTLDRGTT